MENYYNKDVESCLNLTKSAKNGLSSLEAENRLKANGINSIDNYKKKNWFLILLKQFTDIMTIILVIAGVISVVFAILNKSTSEVVDACIIFAVVLLNGLLGFFQELKADKSLENLKKLTVAESKVIRDGKLIKIHSEEIVVGDVVFLEAGDIVPADMRLIETVHFKVEESSLTGESHSIEKNAETLHGSVALGDRKNMAFMGTTVSYGRAYGVVVATAFNTEMGKIASMLKVKEKEQTPIQKDLKILGKFITFVVLGISVVIFLLELFRSNLGILNAFMISVAIAVAAIPESLQAVVTIIMSLGVSKLAKKRAIVKKLSSIETLGCCEIICSDKTGTLTENKMTVTNIFDGNVDYVADKNFCVASKSLEIMLKNMALCNTCVVNNTSVLGDPTEVALVEFANRNLFYKNELLNQFRLIDEFPFDSNRKLMSTIHQNAEETVAFTKGGLDEVLNCCTTIMLKGKVVNLTDKIKNKIQNVAKEYASSALRVLAFAYGKTAELEMTFLGLVGMIDPPREEAFKAVLECKKAGMTPIMITGDHKDTAFEIAKRLKIAKKESEVLTGAELDKLSEEEYLKKLKTIKVYARVSPENKVRIVNAYKKIKKIVAMTGDGVNDAPSIKKADIGIGMGISGTDISKQVADIIISDDNFATIIIAIEEGRKIFKNIEKTIKFLLSANLAETLSILLATLIFPELTFLLPVQILFVNLISDSLPAVALGLEPAEKKLMLEKPRDVSKNILQNGNAFQMLFYAIIQTAIILGVFLIGLQLFDAQVASTMAFYALNIVQMFFIFAIRIEDYFFKSNMFKNKWVWITVLITSVILLIVGLTPIRNVFHLSLISFDAFAISFALPILIIPISDLYKFLRNKFSKSGKKRVK